MSCEHLASLWHHLFDVLVPIQRFCQTIYPRTYIPVHLWQLHCWCCMYSKIYEHSFIRLTSYNSRYLNTYTTYHINVLLHLNHPEVIQHLLLNYYFDIEDSHMRNFLQACRLCRPKIRADLLRCCGVRPKSHLHTMTFLHLKPHTVHDCLNNTEPKFVLFPLCSRKRVWCVIVFVVPCQML